MAQTKTITHRIRTMKTRVHKRVRLAVVPHRANQYRPHVVRRYGIVAILVAIIALQGGYNSISHGNVLGVEAQITPSGLLAATNQARADQHEKPLVMNAELNKAAELKVKNMFDKQYWAHTAPDGTTPWHWFGVAGYHYDSAGENLAKDFTTNSSTVAAWMASPSHRANILNASYQDVGFAVMDSTLDGHPTTLIVALYGSPETVAVRGATVSRDVSNIDEPMSLMARLGVGLQSMTPAAVGSVIVLLVATIVALAAHVYRKKLPAHLRRSWYRHHGIYKAIGFASIALIIIFAYGSAGQI
jgi:hypothetical protein